MQLTFGDAEGLGKRKQTRREIFLAEMEQVVPWQQLLGLIAPHYPVSGRPGRQPYALATMLRIHLLQQWYALSDPAMEEALHEIPTGSPPFSRTLTRRPIKAMRSVHVKAQEVHCR
ncbi:transposase, partial [Xanthomonas campestris]|uniref:transposase n=1 Tax=Xanthomonas campestris TaxID=339 RepID=UPI003D6E22EB